MTQANDKYLRDISRKVSSACKARRERGEYTGAFAPFGYQKSTTQKGKLIPDEVTAPIVRQIFTWRAEGLGQSAICKHLDEDGIMPPMGWLRERYNVYGTDYYKATVWQPHTIRQMVKSRIYIGDLAQGKSSQALYAHKPHTSVPESEWLITENAHEPIVSVELWEAANAVGAARKKEYYEDRTYRDLPENLFRGFLCCAVCKTRLSRHYNEKAFQNGQVFQRFYYQCALRHQHPEEQFPMVPLETVYDLVFTLVERQLQSVESLAAIIEKRAKRQENPRALLDAEIAKSTRDLQRIADRLAGLYENYADKLLSEQEYVQFKTDYENKTTVLRGRLEELSHRAALMEDVSVSENRWLAAVRSFQNPTELTRQMLEALVERIDLHGTDRVDIVWKFSDEFERLKACAKEEECCDG